MIADPTEQIARRLLAERESRGWSQGELAARAGVSKAMISKIERGEASPTAALLARLSGAFELTLATLLARAENEGGRLTRAAEQAIWQDPATRYVRRQLYARPGGPVELVQVSLPAGAEVARHQEQERQGRGQHRQGGRQGGRAPALRQRREVGERQQQPAQPRPQAGQQQLAGRPGLEEQGIVRAQQLHQRAGRVGPGRRGSRVHAATVRRRGPAVNAAVSLDRPRRPA